MKYEHDHSLSSTKSFLETEKDRLKSVESTSAFLAAGILIIFAIGMYILSNIMEERNWWFLIGVVFIGYVFYRAFENLKDYERAIKSDITDLQRLISKKEKAEK